MQRVVMVAVTAGLAATAAGEPPRLGPEWTRVGEEYRRKQEVTVTRFGGGNVSSRTVPLSKDTVYIHEVDDDIGFTVGSSPHGSLEVRKPRAGRPAGYTVALGRVLYFDLNGDGVIDAQYDPDGGSKIWFEGRLVRVEDHKDGFAGWSKRDLAGSVRYTFDGAAWKVSPARAR